MSPCNKGDEQKITLGISPIAAGKKPFRPAKGKARQIGIPKPKVHILCLFVCLCVCVCAVRVYARVC